ncbi:zinc knuckle domain-containing protein [Trichoderma sp. SZMC 28012]
MFGARGRGGPSRSTPANVQCQKCLKRGHYSYECKSSTQERPYVSRPSRSQQLRNPKLVPKLTSDTPNPLEKKKGVADEELAKIETERERKRELEEREDELLDAGSRRRRSVSSHSVSTISTDASRDSRSPPPRRRTRSPTPDRRGHSPDLASDRSYSRSPSPPRRERRSVSRDSPSPSREDLPRGDRGRRGQPSHGREDDVSPPRQRQRDQEPGRRHGRRRSWSDSRSRSPQQDDRPYRRRDEDAPQRGGRRGGRGGGRGGGQGRAPPREAPRERSLSPFSKRLALTQSMNMGGR